jgi:hypothetical protein
VLLLNKKKNAWRKFAKDSRVLFFLVIFILLIFRLSWINTLIERDEAVYGYTGMIWSKGYEPYRDIQDNKGPIIYIFYRVTIELFGNTILPMRILNDILFLVSIIAVYYIAAKWFNQKVALAVVVFYGVFMSVPVFQGIQAMSESLSVPFVVFSLFFAVIAFTRRANVFWLFSGVTVCTAILIRQSQVFAIGFLLLLLFLTYKESPKRRSKWAYSLFAFGAGILLLSSIIFGYLYSQGILGDAVKVLLLGGYHSSYYSTYWNLPFGMIFLIIVEGLPLWLFGFFGLIVAFSIKGKYNLILIAWVVLSFCSVLIARPYGHSFAQMIVPFSFLSGIAICWVFQRSQVSGERFYVPPPDKITKRMFSSILLLTIIPSAFFVGLQYPNLNINWQFVQWQYEDSLTFDQQNALANFLIEQNSSFLIHGWTTLPYWYAGKVAPLVGYTSTVPHQSLGIRMPETEYAKLIGLIQNQTFEHIIIYRSNVEDLYNNQNDQVILWTTENYFYTQSIGNAQVFSKYDPSNTRLNYNFIANFQNATLQFESSNGTIGKTALDLSSVFVPKSVDLVIPQVSGRSKAITQLPIPYMESQIVYDSITVPANSQLIFGFLTYSTTWENEKGDGVQFKITIRTDQETSTIFSQYIDPKHNLAERELFNVFVKLDDFTDQTVSIIFSTLAGPSNDNFDDWAYWVNPVIRTSK